MATTLTLTIGGVSFISKYQTGTAKITAQIQNQGDVFDFTIVQKTGQTAPQIGQEVVFADGGRTLFGGFITKLTPTEYGIGQLIEWQVEASDYTYILINKTAQAGYEAMTLGDIVADLMSVNVAAGYGFSTSGVSVGPTITSINFNHISIRQCFENLAKLTGYIWWVGYDKVIHFTDPSVIALAPEHITDSSANHEAGLTITVDISQVRNDIVILGGTQESNQYTQIILGDANAREWVLVYPVQNMVSVELSLGGGAYATQTFGIDPVDDETAFFAMYSPPRGSIRLSSGSTTLGATDKLRVKFTYPLPVLTEVRSAPSIIAMQALEGGDGIHKYTINDPTIVSNDQAVQQALQELATYANPILSGQFFTRTGLLAAGSYWTPGTALTVNLPAWGINSDTVYVIQKVITTLDESGSAIEYHYDVTFGGRLLGVIDFLQALATPQVPLDTSGEIQKIQAVADVITVAEVITRNNNVRSVTETVTVAESISKINQTPPFQYGGGGSPQGRYNESEYA